MLIPFWFGNFISFEAKFGPCGVSGSNQCRIHPTILSLYIRSSKLISFVFGWNLELNFERYSLIFKISLLRRMLTSTWSKYSSQVCWIFVCILTWIISAWISMLQYRVLKNYDIDPQIIGSIVADCVIIEWNVCLCLSLSSLILNFCRVL